MQLIPRDYQQAAYNESVKYLKSTDKPGILNLATGAGKSIIVAMMAEWLHRNDKRVLVLTHSSDLVQQNHAKYLMTGNEAGIFSAKLGKKHSRHQVIFGGVQSIVRSLHLFTESVSLIVIDECHIVSDDPDTSYQKVIAHFKTLNPNLRVIGLTATPSRGKNALVSDGSFFKKEIFKVGTKELIERKFLVPILYGAPTAQEYQLAGISVNSLGKFDQAKIDAATLGHERLTREICIDIMANMHAQNRRLCMIFAASIQHAKEICGYLPAGLTALVTGETAQKDRDAILESARTGPLQYLVNVGVLTTGVDIPRCDCIALLRATESPALMIQIIGRGLRLAEWLGKTDCLLLDYGQNIDRHGDVEDDIFSDLEAQKVKEKSGDLTKVCPECSQESPMMARRCKCETWEGTKCGYRFEFKTCPECDSQNDITARYCWQCQHELVDPNDKLSRHSSRGNQQNLDNLPVLSTALSPHSKDGKVLLRVDYTLQGNGRVITAAEFFHDQHEAPFVVMKYQQFCKDIGAKGSIEEVLDFDGYAGPEALTIKKTGKYYNVVKRHIGKPTPVTVSKKARWTWH